MHVNKKNILGVFKDFFHFLYPKLLMLRIQLLTKFNFQTKFCFLCVFAKVHFKFNLGANFSCFDQKWLKYSLESKKVNQSHIALWSQWCYGMCTYVIWEEFWKGVELPVSPLISDCSLCKREPWHLCKGSRGLSLVLYMSSSFVLLGVESLDFSHAVRERNACKSEQIHKMTIIFTQNGPT